MYVLTLDQEGSRADEDRVPSLLAAFADLSTVRPFVRTAGDEVQAVLEHPEAVLDVVLWVLRDGRWHCGIGVGSVDLSPADDAPDSRSGKGPAFIHARHAVEEAKRSVGSIRVEGENTRAVHNLQALLDILEVVIAGRTERQWAVIDEVEIHGGISAAAHVLGVRPQSVSEAYARSARRIEQACYPLLLELITELKEEGKP